MRARRERVTFFTIRTTRFHCASVAATLSQGPTGGFTCSHRFWSVLCGPKIVRFWDSPKRAGKVPFVGLSSWEKRRGGSSGDDFPGDIPSASCSLLYFSLAWNSGLNFVWSEHHLFVNVDVVVRLAEADSVAVVDLGEFASAMTASAGEFSLTCLAKWRGQIGNGFPDEGDDEEQDFWEILWSWMAFTMFCRNIWDSGSVLSAMWLTASMMRAIRAPVGI